MYVTAAFGQAGTSWDLNSKLSFGIEEGKSILIVDDDQGIRESLKAILELEGYNAYTAENGKAALQTLIEIPRPDIILLDLMMPVMNGWEFVDQAAIDPEFASIPILVMTAMPKLKHGVNGSDVINKPLDIDQLLAKIKAKSEISLN